MTFSAVLGAVAARVRAGGCLLLLTALGCQSDERPIGGETHFLTCSADSECRELSDKHVCIDEVCQLPEPLPVVDAGEPSPEPDAGRCPQGIAEASETVLLGDSFFASGETSARLSELAVAAEVLPVDGAYRDYSRLVANGLAAGGNGILAQYTDAVAEGSVSTVVMNGGGADVLIGTCETVDAECPVLSAAVAAAADLLEAMSEDGVREVIYVFYPDPTEAEIRAKMDVLRPLIQEVCEQAPMPCHWLDLRESFAGRYAEFIDAAGLNPTTAGAEATAEEIWRVMRESCLAP